MECKKVKEKLSAFMDNELKDNDRLKIDQHLAVCSFCMQEAKLLAQTWSALEVWEKMEVPDDFETRFWQRIREREQKELPIKGLIRSIVRIPVPAAAVIILVVGLILGNYLGNILYPKETKPSNDKVVALGKNDVLYLDTFDDLPPESVGNVYISLVSLKENNYQRRLKR